MSALTVRRWIGVDKVFLTDNAPKSALNVSLLGSPALGKFTENGFLQLDTESKPHAQLAVYQKCILNHARKYNWMAFFDLDEFLVVRECASLPFYNSDPPTFHTLACLHCMPSDILQ
jgi:hypothetical protein